MRRAIRRIHDSNRAQDVAIFAAYAGAFLTVFFWRWWVALDPWTLIITESAGSGPPG